MSSKDLEAFEIFLSQLEIVTDDRKHHGISEKFMIFAMHRHLKIDNGSYLSFKNDKIVLQWTPFKNMMLSLTHLKEYYVKYVLSKEYAFKYVIAQEWIFNNAVEQLRISVI